MMTVSMYISFELTAINDVIRSISIHTIYFIGICP